jgi:phytoene dehydrogenase-like protein
VAHTPDAVVVGGGHNGLVAANLLVDAGWDVLVLEATGHVGGAVRSAPDTPAPGFTADLFSAFYPLGAASPVLRALDLHRHGLTWRHAPEVLAHVFDDGRAALLSRDVDRTADSVDEFAVGDGAAWRRQCEKWSAVEDDVLTALFAPFPPVRAGLRLARHVGIGHGLRLARFGVLPVRRFVEEEFRGAGARMLVAGNALHTDLSPESAGGALYGMLLAMVGQRYGFPVPAGGSGRIVDALVDRLVSRGGRVRCSTPVERVVVHDGRATGVVTAAGERVPASRAVLADVPAPILYGRLLAGLDLPARLRADLERFQWDAATVKVDWALRGSVPWSAAAAGRAGTVHLGADLDGLTRYAADLATQRTPGRPFTLFGQMTTADPSRSPEGTESAWAYTHLPRKSWTPGEVEAAAERVEAEVERHAPGFRDLVVGRLVQGPGDLESADPGLVGGAVNGGTAAIHQQLVLRPTPGLGRADTVVAGLFLAGSSAHPGGGVHGGCGANAARAALARARVGRAAYDRAMGYLEDLVLR